MKRTLMGLIVLVCFGHGVAAAEDECISAYRENGLAIEVRDFKGILRSVEKMMRACEPTDRMRASYRAQRTLALTNLGRLKEGLAEADKCTQDYFADPGCYYWKAVIYKKLSNAKEFAKAKVAAVRICNAIIARAEETRKNAVGKIDTDNVNADIEVARITLNNLNQLFFE